jgi:hypothetical protein
MKILSILLLVAGVAVLAFGVIQLVQYNGSLGGKIANKTAGLFGGHSKGIETPVIMIAAGGAAALVGFFLYRKS